MKDFDLGQDGAGHRPVLNWPLRRALTRSEKYPSRANDAGGFWGAMTRLRCQVGIPAAQLEESTKTASRF